jgi:hypothetical protein
MYRSYKGKAEFLLVYIREAHPDSVVTIVKDGKASLDKVGQTNSVKERTERARQFVDAMKVTIPVVIDGEKNEVNAAYAGWPERLYVIGTDGKIAYKGGPGPGGFKVGEVEKWLRDNAK